MESQSDVSSLSSQHLEQANQVPSIHVDQYIHNQLQKTSQSPQQTPFPKGFPRIFTVAQTLRDPLILNHIKPDYGSLGQFIGDLNIGRDLLTQKKRKNQGSQDDIEERKIKSIYRDKGHEELNRAFLDKSSTNLQKRIVGKMLVENLFKDSFGMTLNSFENQNVKPGPVKNYKINLSQIDQIFEGKKATIKKLQQNAQKQFPERNKKQQSSKQYQKTKQQKSWSPQQRHQIITQIKSKYQSLKKLPIKPECPQYKKLLPPTPQQEQLNFSKRTLQEKPQKQPPTHILDLTETSFKIEKLTIKPELMLFLMSQFPIEKLEVISMSQVRITEELLCFMVEVVKVCSGGFWKLGISRISIQRNGTFAGKVKELLETLPLRELTLDCIDMETREFCVICLGIGSNTSLEVFNFDNNAVDERACKSLQLISKHCQNLKKISLRKNYLQPHHLSYFPAEAKAKIVI